MYYFSAMEKKEYSLTKGTKDRGRAIARVIAIPLTKENQAYCLFVNLSVMQQKRTKVQLNSSFRLCT